MRLTEAQYISAYNSFESIVKKAINERLEVSLEYWILAHQAELD